MVKIILILIKIMSIDSFHLHIITNYIYFFK